MKAETNWALRVEEASVAFGDFTALSSVTFAVPAGEIHAVIGPNGAGKSTLFGLLTGEVHATRGQVWVAGKNITGAGAVQVARAGLAKMFQRTSVFPRLTVEECVRLAVLGRERGKGRSGRTVVRKEVSRALELTRLDARRTAVAGSLSLADQRLVELSMCLGTRPAVLLLDEPTAGMSAGETDATVSMVRELSETTGLTVVVSEHDMDVIFGLAERIWVLVDGEFLCSGDRETVRGHPEVRRIYFETGQDED